MYHSCRTQIIGESRELVNYSLPSLPSPHSVCWIVIQSVTKTDRHTHSVSQSVSMSVGQSGSALSQSVRRQAVSQSINQSFSQSVSRPNGRSVS